MRYVADWAPLAEARRLVESCGFSTDDAELDICRAMADQKIPLRVTRLHGSGANEPPAPYFRLRVPNRLSPQDFDWDRSITITPWPEATPVGLARLRYAPPARQVNLSIELSTKAVLRVLCGGRYPAQPANADSNRASLEPAAGEEDLPTGSAAREENIPTAVSTPTRDSPAEHSCARRKGAPKFELARHGLEKAFPGGVPDERQVPNKEMCNQVYKALGSEARELSHDTIERAAGRRK